MSLSRRVALAEHLAETAISMSRQLEMSVCCVSITIRDEAGVTTSLRVSHEALQDLEDGQQQEFMKTVSATMSDTLEEHLLKLPGCIVIEPNPKEMP